MDTPKPNRPAERLLNEILARLIRGEAAEGWSFEPYGETVTDSWGSGQWIKFTEPDGRGHYARVVVEPNRAT